MTETQHEALSALGELWELVPDVRLGQLIAHLGLLAEDQLGRTLAELDDEEFLSIVYRHRAELQARQPESSAVPHVNIDASLPTQPFERH